MPARVPFRNLDTARRDVMERLDAKLSQRYGEVARLLGHYASSDACPTLAEARPHQQKARASRRVLVALARRVDLLTEAAEFLGLAGWAGERLDRHRAACKSLEAAHDARSFFPGERQS